ncbi:MAG: shikimate kinase [Thermoanaerobaculia bacterium]|nr:shikimate kinase [Thermoanaerobaculia bacterium]
MRIYLIGFMGAGKTTAGRRLARRLGLAFVDLDAEIEAEAGRSVAEIFAAEGEAGFRERERRALGRVAAGPEAVVATGGGLPLSPANRDLMRATGVTVWLDPGVETAITRLAGAPGRERPLFADAEEARRLYRRRTPAYRTADHRLRIGPEEGPHRVATRIATLLEERRCAT